MKFEIDLAYNSMHDIILCCYTNPADSTDQPPFQRMYSIQTAAFADDVLPVMSLFSPKAAFADNVLPVLSPFFIDNGICRKCATSNVPVFADGGICR
jgi:hypothetical protein